MNTIAKVESLTYFQEDEVLFVFLRACVTAITPSWADFEIFVVVEKGVSERWSQ